MSGTFSAPQYALEAGCSTIGRAGGASLVDPPPPAGRALTARLLTAVAQRRRCISLWSIVGK